jgi:Amt family ammonium transporter
VEFQTNLNFVWTLVAAILVFGMQAGFACLEAGLVRTKNSINVVMKNLADISVVSLMFLWIGFPLMFGASYHGWFGSSGFFLQSGLDFSDPWLLAFMMFQIVFAGTAATIVSGAVAERMLFLPYLIVSVFISIVIYPVFGHWAWGNLFIPDQSGWLGAKGFMDFAGSTVVHSIGAWVSLAGVILIGPRLGRYNKDGSMNEITGSSLPLATLGVFLLWMGWFGFNAGSTTIGDSSIAKIALNTMISASAGGLATIVLSYLIHKQAKVEIVLNGILAGLVGITAGCNVMGINSSVLVGFISGLLVFGTQYVMERKLKLDDAVGAIPVHGVGGVWGTIAVALFAPVDLLQTGSRLEQLGVQLLGVGSAFIWSFGLGFLVFWALKKTMGIRVKSEDELSGLNYAEHGAKIALMDSVAAMHQISATHDLTHQLPESESDDHVELHRAFNEMLYSLRDLVGMSKVQTNAVQRSAGQVAASSQTIEQELGVHHRNVEQMNYSLQSIQNSLVEQVVRDEQFFATIGNSLEIFQKNASRIQEMSATTEETIRWIERVIATDQVEMADTMKQLQTQMSHMSSFSAELGGMVQFLATISDQINLLALNASIEAARSDRGSEGFAVVAAEIKKLADQTNQSLGQIRGSIEGNLGYLEQAITGIQEADRKFTTMFGSLETMNDKSANLLKFIREIESDTMHQMHTFEHLSETAEVVQHEREEQTSHLEEIASQLTDVHTATEKIYKLIQQISRHAMQMNQSTKGLSQMIEQFKTETLSPEGSKPLSAASDEPRIPPTVTHVPFIQ